MEKFKSGRLSGKHFFSKKKILLAAAIVLLAGTAGGLFLVKAGDNPAFCSSCHIMKPYYESWHDSNLLAQKHADAGVTCHDCHEASVATQAEEGIKYITGSYKNPLDKRTFSKQMCLDCHDDFAEIQAKTNFEESNPHDSHNGNQECNVCHSMHQESELMCSQCHVFTWSLELDDSWRQ